MRWTREGEQVWHSGKKRAKLFFVYLKMPNGMWAMTCHCEACTEFPVIGYYLLSEKRCRKVAESLRKRCKPVLKEREGFRIVQQGEVLHVAFQWKVLRPMLAVSGKAREPKSLK